MPATDRFYKHTPTVGTAYQDAEAVSPDDAAEIIPTRGLYVGGAGNVVVLMKGYGDEAPNQVTFTGVAAGSILPIRVSKVLLTGTTATSILALY